MKKKRQINFKPVESHPDFIKMEEETLERWYRDGVVKKYLKRNSDSKEKFSFLDGPITANNPMGVHHARGRTYKDLWQRYQTMKGKKQRYRNGFDCQGLWVEVEVEKELGFRNKKDILEYGVEKFVNKCKQRVYKFAEVQTEQSKRLGMFMDWKNSYFTMDDENNYWIWKFLKVCHQRGWIYKGHGSVPWCPRCETAISQHEMLTEDYKEVTHEAIFMKFPIEARENEYLLVWTTTPWTIPANIAVAIDINLDYSLVEGETGGRYWLAKEMISRVFEKSDYKIIKTIKGKEMVGWKYRGPFDDLPAVAKVARDNPKTFHAIVATDNKIMPINIDEGTGLVHTAVSAGTEDFRLGAKYGLPIVPVIADNADYLAEMGWLAGKNAKKHPELILDCLREKDKKTGQNWVFKIHKYKHRYPVCWRCKTELVWKVTDEWYVAMDLRPSRSQKSPPWAGQAPVKSQKSKEKTLREQMKEVAKKIKWIPEFGLQRELDWLDNMHDWLISKKNRFWGLALPIYECKKCGHFEVIGSKEELSKRAVEGWENFDGHSPHKPWVDEVRIRCSDCGEIVSRIEPVGNPWLDAGIVSFSTMPKEWFPADFITESFPGQFKNWFYALLVMSTVLKNNNPFKTVLGFESVVGQDGRPMHKSWGNAIEFNEGASKIGVDVMRWMYSRVVPTQVLPFGYQKGDEIKKRFLLILWNSFRFFVTQANADGWLPKKVVKSKNKLPILDRWILSRLGKTINDVTSGLDKFESAPATEALELLVDDFSTWYIRRSRNRVGVAAADRGDKESAYQTMDRVLVDMSKLLAPFMPYVSDFIYRSLTGEESVHLVDWPKANQLNIDNKLIRDMEQVRKEASLAHSQRKAGNLPVRQPLNSLSTERKADEELDKLLRDEVNVHWIVHLKKLDNPEMPLDMKLTGELKRERQAREIIRSVQELRKKENTDLTEKIKIYWPDWPEEFEEEIKRATLAESMNKSSTPKITRFR